MSPHTDAGELLKLAEAEGLKRFPPKDPGDMGVDLNKWSRECFVEGFIAARQAASQGSAGVAQAPTNCDCGFSAEVCRTNPCMRKKMATSGLNPEAKYPYCGTEGATQAPSKEETFCHWLKGYLGAIKGRDELDAREANVVRNKLNEMLDGTSPIPSAHHSPPDIRASHNTGERLPSSDAAVSGGEAYNCKRCIKCLDEGFTATPESPFPPSRQRMVVCQHCGNKRCPCATNHRNPCTNSNMVGQPGSVFGPVVTSTTRETPNA